MYVFQMSKLNTVISLFDYILRSRWTMYSE